MFLASVPRVPYVDPLQAPLAERLTQLGRGLRHVAYFYARPDTSTFRYRVLNMIEALRGADPEVGAAWFAAADLEHTDAILDRADVVVICRVLYTAGFAHVIAGARARGLRVLFDVDDLVFDDRFTQLVMETLDVTQDEAAWTSWFGWIARAGAMMRLCDGVIVTNGFLAERAQAFSGLPTAIVPNFLNAAQLETSARILAGKQATGFARDDRIHFGYFSGTPSHNRDFAIIADTLADLMASHPRLCLRIVGYLEPGPRLLSFGDRVERWPLQDFVNLQRLIGEIEFNLAPLQNNVFTACKSELKVFEASAVGTISIASPGFRLAVRDGQTGYVAPAQDWPHVLAVALSRLDDYPTMAAAAATAALASYSPSRQGRRIVHALFGVHCSPAFRDPQQVAQS